MTTKIGTLRNVTIDAPDHRALGHFYRELTGATIRADFDHWFVIMTPAGAKLGFQPVPDLRRSTWPRRPRRPNRWAPRRLAAMAKTSPF